MIYQSIEEMIGDTPLLHLKRWERAHGCVAEVYAKLEKYNPSGSSKDRAAAAIIADAEERGLLKEGSVIVEPTSGNTGIGLAALAAAKGYRLILVMPETMSEERKNLLRLYGAELVLTDGALGMKGAIERADELVRTTDGAFLAGQFTNPVNPLSHYRTTGAEIWKDLSGNVDLFVATVGTGGTVSGVGRYLKERNPSATVIAVEPSASPYLSKGKSGAHAIQGIGAGFAPETLDRNSYDEVIAVGDDGAFLYAKELAVTEGISVGISSGAALFAAAQVASRRENAGKNLVVLLPDGGDRYYSTPLFQQ